MITVSSLFPGDLRGEGSPSVTVGNDVGEGFPGPCAGQSISH